jgi:hypothetical protein
MALLIPQQVKLKDNQAIVVVNGEGVTLAKIYLSIDQRKLRIVLPEFKSLCQPKLDDVHGIIDFTRDPHTAREELSARQRQVKGL